MATVRVIALEPGFYDGHRIRAGQSFDFDTKHATAAEGGGYVLPGWVIPDAPGARETASNTVKKLDDKAHAAAIASSGDGASGGAVTRKGNFIKALAGE